jgi:rod shape-determining protein MreC
MVSDYRYQQLKILRDYLSLVIYPIQWLVDAPVRFTSTLQQYTQTYQQLVAENQQLRHEQLLQNARTQKFMSLEAENVRLRSLLQSSPRDGETLLVAEIIRVDSDPLIQRVILDKGSRHGVALGQTVIDAEGVIGEVIEVNPMVSRVILLTDTSYGIPVENIRNGIRGIVAGTGAIKNLELQHVPNTIDLKVGDALVTSGLDGRYPPGYPVGMISQIQHDPGESFARIQVTPSAHLERTRQVLLVQRSKEAMQVPSLVSTLEAKAKADNAKKKTKKEKNRAVD